MASFQLSAFQAFLKKERCYHFPFGEMKHRLMNGEKWNRIVLLRRRVEKEYSVTID